LESLESHVNTSFSSQKSIGFLVRLPEYLLLPKRRRKAGFFSLSTAAVTKESSCVKEGAVDPEYAAVLCSLLSSSSVLLYRGQEDEAESQALPLGMEVGVESSLLSEECVGTLLLSVYRCYGFLRGEFKFHVAVQRAIAIDSGKEDSVFAAVRVL